MNWTTEQILGWSPDAATTKRGQELSNPHKWAHLAKEGNAIWGLCQGSGNAPYQTVVDLRIPTFKCSCPVRKLPCKHILGLTLSFAQQPQHFTNQPMPNWVEQWIQERDKRAVAASTKQQSESSQAALPSMEQLDERLILMQSGLESLGIWLQDLISMGLASNTAQSYAFWEEMAARMIDAKLSGVANILREIPLLMNSENWVTKVMHKVADLQLLISSFPQLAQMDDAMRADWLQITGVNAKKEAIREQKALSDTWLVIGIIKGQAIDPNLVFRRTWFFGKKTGRFALFLDFSFRDSGFGEQYYVGQLLHGSVAYYPSNTPLRALPINVISEDAQPALNLSFGLLSFENFLEHYSHSRSKNVWLVEYPCPLSQVVPMIRNGQLALIDQQKNIIPTLPSVLNNWKLLAFSSGKPIHIFGEWSGDYLVPLSASQHERSLIL